MVCAVKKDLGLTSLGGDSPKRHPFIQPLISKAEELRSSCA